MARVWRSVYTGSTRKSHYRLVAPTPTPNHQRRRLRRNSPARPVSAPGLPWREEMIPGFVFCLIQRKAQLPHVTEDLKRIPGLAAGPKPEGSVVTHPDRVPLLDDLAIEVVVVSTLLAVMTVPSTSTPTMLEMCSAAVRRCQDTVAAQIQFEKTPS